MHRDGECDVAGGERFLADARAFASALRGVREEIAGVEAPSQGAK